MQIIPRIQNVPGIYVYQENKYDWFGGWLSPHPRFKDHADAGKRILCTYYETLDDFFSCHPFSNWSFTRSLPELHVYDQDCNYFSHDRLIGYHRLYHEARRKYYKQFRWRKRQGCKKHVWGQGRIPKTQNERKQSFNVEEFADEIGFPIKVRSCRNADHLVQWWDCRPTHVEKNWKYQSKRRRQWKPK